MDARPLKYSFGPRTFSPTRTSPPLSGGNKRRHKRALSDDLGARDFTDRLALRGNSLIERSPALEPLGALPPATGAASLPARSVSPARVPFAASSLPSAEFELAPMRGRAKSPQPLNRTLSGSGSFGHALPPPLGHVGRQTSSPASVGGGGALASHLLGRETPPSSATAPASPPVHTRNGTSAAGPRRPTDLQVMQHVVQRKDVPGVSDDCENSFIGKIGLLLRATAAVSEHMNFDLAAERIVRETCSICEAQRCTYFTVDETTKELVAKYSYTAASMRHSESAMMFAARGQAALIKQAEEIARMSGESPESNKMSPLPVVPGQTPPPLSPNSSGGTTHLKAALSSERLTVGLGAMSPAQRKSLTDLLEGNNSSSTHTTPLLKREASGDLSRSMEFPMGATRDLMRCTVPPGHGAVGRCAAKGKMVNVKDASKSSFPLHANELVDPLNPDRDVPVTNMICMPLRSRSGKIVAVLAVYNKRPVENGASLAVPSSVLGNSFPGLTPLTEEPCFGPEDEFLLETLCQQASIALRNSHVFQASMNTHRKMNVILDVAKSLGSTMDTTQLIQVIMSNARDLLEADRCTLFLLDMERQELWSKVADGQREIRIPMTAGLAGYVATKGTMLNIPDAYDDHRFSRAMDDRTGYRTRSVLCMPIRNKDGQILGVTQLMNKKSGVFVKEDEVLLEAFSAQAAVAIQNAQMFQQVLEMGNYLQSVLNSITNLVLTFDNEGRLKTTNRSVTEFIGEQDDVMRLQSYAEWILPENAQLRDDMTRVYEGGTQIFARDFEYHTSGRTININYNVAALLDHERTQTGVVVVIEDISSEKRLLSAMSRYMSPALAQKVLEDGGARLGGVRQHVTVLFCDIRGFTTLAENLDAAGVVDMLNEYFSVMVNAIFQERGVLDKYIGDALMAVFGVPFPEADDAVRCCRAALLMREYLAVFNEKRAQHGLPPIRNGIGIATGTVLCGNIGSEKRLEYTVIGDNVNLGSRLESITKRYKVNTLVSEATYVQAKDLFFFREIDTVRVVGKAQGVKIYELLAETRDEVPAAKLEAIELFARGRTAYLDQRWAEARNLFESAYHVGGDETAHMYMERCDLFAVEPPPADWGGIFTADKK